MIEETLDRLMRDVPDFPKPGIVFKDITPLLADASALREVAQAMAAPWRDRGVTHVVGVESRGFLFGTAVAMELGATAVLMNTAIAQAKEPVKMARAMKYAVEAGRLAYLSGRMPKKMYADPSSPLAGLI